MTLDMASQKRKRTRTGRANKRKEARELPFPLGWGGARRGAGRKRDPRSGVPHRSRPRLRRRDPVHLTWKLVEGLPSLRSTGLFAVLREAFDGGRDRFGFRLVQFSVQGNHLHLIAEAEDERSLSRGMQGLGVRIAKRLNRALDRSGRVLAERYHARQIQSPTQARSALRYVLNNALRHGLRCALPDPCSSGSSFDGWDREQPPPRRSVPVCRARTWLLTIGWRREGLIGLDEVPAAAG